MDLVDFGSLGYQVGGAGIVAFTLAYLVIVRWWTDTLGRVVAGVMSATSGVLIITTLRQIYPGHDGSILVYRAVVFWLFGAAVWSALSIFVWVQFLAPRIRRSTPREKHEEVALADSWHDPDVGLHDVSGGHDR
jgi:MFS family permease